MNEFVSFFFLSIALIAPGVLIYWGIKVFRAMVHLAKFYDETM